MVVTVYLFFVFLIAFTHEEVSSNEDHNLAGILKSSSDLPARDQSDQTNQNDLDEQDENVTMYEYPLFTNYKKMVKIHVKPAGNTIRLTCKAHGIPTPNITWYKNNEKPIKHLGIIRYGRWYLSLEDLVTDDSGIYTCVVCNIVGCIRYNYTVEVVERYPNRPIITNPPQNKTVVVGSNASFTCTFLSDLNHQIYWVAGISPENSSVKNSATIQNPEILEICNVTHESEGWYTCVVANSLGTTLASAYLKVVDTLEETSSPQLVA